MAVFKKKFKPQPTAHLGQSNDAVAEVRQPNHWSFDDDPLLNMEPVFSDDPLIPSNPFEGMEEHIARPGVNSDEEAIQGIQSIIANRKAASPKSPSTGGVLGNIIGAARQKAEQVQADVIARDPVIAKLQKIEELMRNGGVDADLYTDVSKSNNTSYYAQRAAEFQKKNSTSSVKHNETDLERARRMAREAQEKRELMRGEVIQESEDKQIKEAKEFQANEGINIYRSRANAKIQESEEKLKKSSVNKFDSPILKAKKKIEEQKLAEAAKPKVTKSVKYSKDIGFEAKIEMLLQEEPVKATPQPEPAFLNAKKIASEKKEKAAVDKIAALEARVAEKAAKLEKHKEMLAKKEAKIKKLEEETIELANLKEKEKKLTKEEQALKKREKELKEKEKLLKQTKEQLIIKPRPRKK